MVCLVVSATGHSGSTAMFGLRLGLVHTSLCVTVSYNCGTRDAYIFVPDYQCIKFISNTAYFFFDKGEKAPASASIDACGPLLILLTYSTNPKYKLITNHGSLRVST